MYRFETGRSNNAWSIAHTRKANAASRSTAAVALAPSSQMLESDARAFTILSSKLLFTSSVHADADEDPITCAGFLAPSEFLSLIRL